MSVTTRDSVSNFQINIGSVLYLLLVTVVAGTSMIVDMTESNKVSTIHSRTLNSIHTVCA